MHKYLAMVTIHTVCIYLGFLLLSKYPVLKTRSRVLTYSIHYSIHCWEIKSYFLPECVHVCVCYTVLITAHFVGKMTRRIKRVCARVCIVYFAATLIRARLKCAYKILTAGKKYYNMAVCIRERCQNKSMSSALVEKNCTCRTDYVFVYRKKTESCALECTFKRFDADLVPFSKFIDD